MCSNAGMLKKLEAQASKKASCVTKVTPPKEALDISVASAEILMKALEIASNEQDRLRISRKCRVLLNQAEQIKKTIATSSLMKPAELSRTSTSLQRRDAGSAPSNRSLSRREKIILLEGSKLNGFIFPPWELAPNPEEFVLKTGHERYIDGENLQLSKAQKEVFAGWKRPEDVLCRPNATTSTEHNAALPSMVPENAVHLVQGAVTDCSLVASMDAFIAQGEETIHQVLSLLFYPQSENSRYPVISMNGKYILRMKFNGCFRRVVIDDLLPASRVGRALHVTDRANPQLLWPALVEKAYLKVHGGYDFLGSNPGTDLWILTGWVPEQIFLRGPDSIVDELWVRLKEHFTKGNVMITLGTGRLSHSEETELGLDTEHAYTVLDLRQSATHRLLLVKNPSSSGNAWKARFPTADTVKIGEERLQPRDFHRSLEDTLPSSDRIAPGTAWIDFDDCVQTFESIYLNWNPSIFRYHQDVHFSWDITNTPPGSFRENPQYSATSQSGGVVWFLLSRHMRGEHHLKEPSTSSSSRQSESRSGYITLYAFAQNGHRVHLSRGALQQGPYVDSPQTLLRLDCAAGISYTLVASQELLPLGSCNFTLSTYSSTPVILEPATDSYPYWTSHKCAWTLATAGGNANTGMYSMNPQYSLNVQSSSDVAILLECTQEDIAIDVKVLWANGERVSQVMKRDIVSCSGDYKRGCALAETKNIESGTYTIVCSTYEAGQTGEFVLHVGSTSAHDVQPIPSDTAGRLRWSLSPARFPPGYVKALAPISFQRITKVRLTASLQCSSKSDLTSPPQLTVVGSPIRVSLQLGQGCNWKTLVVSGAGDFADASRGLRTNEVDLVPDVHHHRGRVCIVVERLCGASSAYTEELVAVDILSDRDINVGEWTVSGD